MNWTRFFRRKRLEQELEDEIRSHLAMDVQERIERGEQAEDAHANAYRDFGNTELVKETIRDAWGFRLLDEIRQDLLYAGRLLRRNPVSTIVIVLTIALGIGANTAAYNVVYNVLLRPLPFRDPTRLMQVWETYPDLPQLPVSVPDYYDFQRQAHGFEQISASTFQATNRFTMNGPGDPEAVQATMVTPDFFSTFGIQPLLGRGFTSEDENNKRTVALVSEDLWRRKFGSDPNALGKSIRLETLSVTLIGVVPRAQAFPAWADIWMPFSLLEPELQNRRKYHPLEVVGRLKAGVSESQALAEIQSIAKRSAEELPATNKNMGAYIVPLARQLTDEVRPALLLVWAAVGLVLLIACCNVAHLLMGQMLRRRREMTIRVALGASRLRLIRQVVMESLVLAILGGAAGIAIALWLTSILHRLAADAIPRMQWAGLPGPVWIFSVGASVVCGLLFAMPSCWQALTLHSREGGEWREGRIVTRRRNRLGPMLVAAQFAFAFVVVAGAALLLRSFAVLLNEEPGFNAKDTIAIEVPSSRYDWNKAHEFFDSELMPAVRALPGVVAVAAANSAPMSLGPTEHSRFGTRFRIEGTTFSEGQYLSAQIRWVTPDYFHVLQIPLKQGRWLSQDDRGKPRYLINEAFARQFFPNADPTTKHLILGVVDPVQTSWEIVGVVRDVREMGLDANVLPTLYFISTGPVMTLLVRTGIKPEQLMASIQQKIHQADSQIAVKKPITLQEYVDESLARRRFTLVILGVFAGLGAFLTAAGIYGVLTCSVNARRREFGIRIAVGATQRNIVGMIFREVMMTAIPGLAIGLMLHFAFTRVMKSLIYQVSPADPASIIGAAACLCWASALSAWIPAKRASAVDPGETLRVE
jgi:predicted permease